MAPCLAQHVYLHVACCGSPWHFCFQASPERQAEGVPMIVKLRRGLRASKHEVFKKSKSWYVFSVILQSWQNMCLEKKRGGENLRMPPVLSLCFKQATRKQAWRESNFWKPCCISDSVPVGTCNEMMAWGDCLNLTPDLYDLVISQTTFLLLQYSWIFKIFI